MNIAENILKHSLKNVYFLTGTACGGKTTMAREISAKYGFLHFNDNWHEDHYKIWTSLCDPQYQKNAFRRKNIKDWEAYFGRSVEEFLLDREGYDEGAEYLQFILIELIKAAQNRKVIADIWLSTDLLVEIADYDRIACLLAPPDLVIRDYYDREDHKEFIECIMSLKDPQKKLEVQNELFRIGGKKIYDDAEKYKLFTIERNADSTIGKTLELLEAHFKLKPGAAGANQEPPNR